MRDPRRLLKSLARDQRGGEAMEYAIIAGLIIITAIAVITTIGTRVFGEWTPE